MRRLQGVAAAVVLVAAACGNDSDTEPDEAADPPATPTTEPEAPPADDEPEPEPAEPEELPLAEIDVTLTEVATADAPLALVTRDGSDTLYVAERPGTIRELAVTGTGADRSYDLADEPLIDLRDEVAAPGGNDERGLLDITFSADGSTLYASYTVVPDGDTRIDEIPMDGDTPELGARREVLGLEQPFPNHNGGDIEIGPDGLLWVGLGDGGAGGDPLDHGQNPQTLLGTLLRIDPDNPTDGQGYGVPADNPFADGAGGAPEVWLYGLRNPWRFTFDPTSDDLWIADVGQNAWEEVNLLPADEDLGRGANLGWANMEGTNPFEGRSEPEGHVPPVFEYPNPDDGCSVTGGVVYQGETVPGLVGAYLFSDFCQGSLRALRASDGQVTDQRTFEDVELTGVVSFGEDTDGDAYMLALDGGIYRLDPS